MTATERRLVAAIGAVVMMAGIIATGDHRVSADEAGGRWIERRLKQKKRGIRSSGHPGQSHVHLARGLL